MSSPVARATCAQDVGTMSVVATMLGDAPRALYFPNNLGNLQVGPLEAGDDNHTGIWHLSQVRLLVGQLAAVTCGSPADQLLPDVGGSPGVDVCLRATTN